MRPGRGICGDAAVSASVSRVRRVEAGECLGGGVGSVVSQLAEDSQCRFEEVAGAGRVPGLREDEAKLEGAFRFSVTRSDGAEQLDRTLVSAGGQPEAAGARVDEPEAVPRVGLAVAVRRVLKQPHGRGAVRQRLLVHSQLRLVVPDGVQRESADGLAAVAGMHSQGVPGLAQGAPQIALLFKDPAELPVRL
jgi:hypothetical protein